jgi:hypothetical protein
MRYLRSLFRGGLSTSPFKFNIDKMASTDRSSLSATSSGKDTKKPAKLSDYDTVKESLRVSKLGDKKTREVKALTIKVNDDPDGAVPGFLHLPAPGSFKKVFAAIILS